MQENTNNEFENLYRKAAAEFPLNIVSAYWDAVQMQLEEDKKKRGIFWWNQKALIAFLLLLLSFFSYEYFNKKTDLSKQTLANQTAENNINRKKIEQEITTAVYNKIIDSLDKINKEKIKQQSRKELSFSVVKKIALHNAGTSISKRKTFSKVQKNLTTSANQKTLEPINTNLATLNEHIDETAYNKAFEINMTTEQGEKLVPLTMVMDSIIQPKNISILDSILVLKKESKPTKKTVIHNTKPGFYIGLQYAFDNTITQKERHNEKGENFGVSLLLGYPLSNRFSIETGLGIQNKEYYTNGNSFNKSILNASGNITKIESENSYFDVPISLRYNIIQKNKFQIFSNIGTSSYFINKEKYEYEQENGGIYTKDIVEFSAISTKLFSSLNLSIGCELKIKNWGSLRLQPYYNLPLKSFGNSGLNLISKGVQIGWVYQFTKK